MAAFIASQREQHGVPQVVPAENVCHQAIFTNHASGAVTPPDAEVIQVGDAIRQRA